MTPLAVPAADVYAFARDGRATVLLSSSGPLWLPGPDAPAADRKVAD